MHKLSELFPHAPKQGEGDLCYLRWGYNIVSTYQIQPTRSQASCLLCGISISIANYNIYGTSALKDPKVQYNLS